MVRRASATGYWSSHVLRARSKNGQLPSVAWVVGLGPRRQVLDGRFLTSRTINVNLPAWLVPSIGSADGRLLRYSGPNAAPALALD